jgi:hypothetical protein
MSQAAEAANMIQSMKSAFKKAELRRKPLISNKPDWLSRQFNGLAGGH